MYAKINTLGLLKHLILKFRMHKVDLSEEGIVWLSAEEEEEKVIAQANAALLKDGHFENPRAKCRYEADYPV